MGGTVVSARGTMSKWQVQEGTILKKHLPVFLKASRRLSVAMFTMLTVIILFCETTDVLLEPFFFMHFWVNRGETYIACKLSRSFGSQQRHGIQLHLKSFPLCLLPAFSVFNLTNRITGEWKSLSSLAKSWTEVFLNYKVGTFIYIEQNLGCYYSDNNNY